MIDSFAQNKMLKYSDKLLPVIVAKDTFCVNRQYFLISCQFYLQWFLYKKISKRYNFQKKSRLAYIPRYEIYISENLKFEYWSKIKKIFSFNDLNEKVRWVKCLMKAGPGEYNGKSENKLMDAISW